MTDGQAAQLAQKRRRNHNGRLTPFALQSRGSAGQADHVGLGHALMPAAAQKVINRQAVVRDMMIDGSGGNVEDDRPSPARGEPDGQLCLFAAARIRAHAPYRFVEAADLEREIGPHAHIGADWIPYLTGGFRQSPIAAADTQSNSGGSHRGRVTGQRGCTLPPVATTSGDE